MTRIILTQFEHRGGQQLGINFAYDIEVKSYVKELPQIKWSQTHQVFYLPYTSANKQLVWKHLRKKSWFVDYSRLSPVEKNVMPSSATSVEKRVILEGNTIVAPHSKSKDERVISEENKDIIRRFVAYLRGLRLSDSTVRIYFTFIADFFHFIGSKPLDTLDNKDVRLFVEETVAKKNYAISTHRQLISSIKHFSEYYPECHISAVDLKRPKKSSFLPEVLSPQEILDLLRATRNLKHRAILALLYSAGLRIGEVLALELHHIDIDRRQLVIKNAKGRKDRNVILAESFIPLLANYFTTYRPKRFFVEGQGGKQYSATSVRAFLRQACQRTGIKKRVTPHTLRHSFATHLMENGVGLRHVQELLGHSKPETTMIYTHVAQKDLLSIRSPLDTAINKFLKTDNKQQNLLLSGKYRG